MTVAFLHERRCGFCPRLFDALSPSAIYCGQKCRQAAFRLCRRRATDALVSALVSTLVSTPMRFAYADPPYPGTAKKYYQHEATYGGEVDHRELLVRLETGRRTHFTHLDGPRLDGWALSTSAKALRDVLPLCPPGARVCPWVKPIGVSRKTYGLHNTWEALIVVGGRQLRPGKRDWLRAMPARGGGSLPGRKPIAFCNFLFDALGMLPGDELVDMFPGSGVGRAWDVVSRRKLDRAIWPGYSDLSSPSSSDDEPELNCHGEHFD